MNQLVVVAFDHFDDARSPLKSLRGLEKQERIRFEDTALVERDPDGTAHVKNEVSGTTETAKVDETSSNDSRSKTPMINRFRALFEAVSSARAVREGASSSSADQ